MIVLSAHFASDTNEKIRLLLGENPCNTPCPVTASASNTKQLLSMEGSPASAADAVELKKEGAIQWLVKLNTSYSLLKAVQFME